MNNQRKLNIILIGAVFFLIANIVNNVEAGEMFKINPH
jgi:hypothetical protein